MSKELIVDGKKYLPSTVLAGRFSYTTDYLGKLAREEKVDATRVGRQWYLSEESLQEFVALTNESKAKRNQTLREERVKERQQKENTEEVTGPLTPLVKKLSPKNSDTTPVTAGVATTKLPSQLESLLQTMAVSFCACLVGVLGFVMFEEGVDTQKLSFGTSHVLGDVVAAIDIAPDTTVEPDTQIAAIDFSAWWKWLFGGVEIEHEIETESVQVAQNEASVIKPIEVKNAMLMLDPTTSTTTVKEIRESFSDEVEVEFDGPDTGVLKPVFREESEESYRFLLVPVVEASSE